MTEAPARAVVVRPLFPASPDVVYDEWLDPGALADWMCPRPARCRNIKSEPRLGGRLRIDIEDGGTEFWVSGEYLVLDRPEAQLQLELLHLAGSGPEERGERAAGAARERADAHDDRAHPPAARARQPA